MFSFVRKVAEVFKKVSSWISGSPTTPPPPQVKETFGEWIQTLRPQWFNVISSYVKAVRYHADTRRLEVNYLGRKICIYSNISPNSFSDMLLSPSKGRWARAHLFPLPYS